VVARAQEMEKRRVSPLRHARAKYAAKVASTSCFSAPLVSVDQTPVSARPQCLSPVCSSAMPGVRLYWPSTVAGESPSSLCSASLPAAHGPAGRRPACSPIGPAYQVTDGPPHHNWRREREGMACLSNWCRGQNSS